MKNTWENFKQGAKKTALTLTTIATLYGLFGPQQAQATSIDDIQTDTTTVNIPDSLDAHNTIRDTTWHRFGDEWVKDGYTQGLYLVKNDGTSNMGREYGLIVDENTIDPTTLSTLESTGMFEGTSTKAIGIKVGSYDNMNSTWTAIDNKFFGGNPVPPEYAFTLHGQVNDEAQVIALDADHPVDTLTTFSEIAGANYYVADEFTSTEDEVNIEFHITDPTGNFGDTIITRNNIGQGTQAVHLLYDNVIETPETDSIHEVNVQTTPGANINVFASDSTTSIDNYVANNSGEANFDLVDTSATQNWYVVIDKNGFEQQDTLWSTTQGATNELNMELDPETALKQYLVFGWTNAREITIVNADNVNDTIFHLTENNGDIDITNNNYLGTTQRPETSLNAIITATNDVDYPGLSFTGTKSLIPSPGTNNENIVIDTTGSVLDYTLAGPCTEGAQYYVINTESNDTIADFVGNVTELYDIPFQSQDNSIQVRYEGHKENHDSVYNDEIITPGVNYYDLTLDSITDGIGDFGLDKKVNELYAYPNPVGSSTTIDLGDKYTQDALVRVIDASGKMQNVPYRQDEENIRLNTEGLSKGTYIISVQNGNEIRSGKIVK